MKKRVFAFLTVLCLMAALAVPALALDGVGTVSNPKPVLSLEYVSDAEQAGTLGDPGEGIFTDEEQIELNEQAREVSEKYDCGVYIVVVPDYRSYGDSVRGAAQFFYSYHHYGLGEDASGVMLFLSMADRDYALIAHGYGNTAFTDYGKEWLQEEFLDDFRDDDWMGGFTDYIRYSGEYLERARAGNPVDIQDQHMGEVLRDEFGPVSLIVALGVIPCGIAFIVCSVMKGKMKSVRTAAGAEFYAVPGSMDLMAATDIFTHTTETRVRIESDSDRGGGGGGGTTIDSSGFSGTSGKF